MYSSLSWVLYFKRLVANYILEQQIFFLFKISFQHILEVPPSGENELKAASKVAIVNGTVNRNLRASHSPLSPQLTAEFTPPRNPMVRRRDGTSSRC